MHSIFFKKLLLQHTHLQNQPRGVDYLRAKIREPYAILKPRFSLRLNKPNRVTCRISYNVNIQPITAYLSVETNAYHSPTFTNGNFDYFEPFYVTIPLTAEKR